MKEETSCKRCGAALEARAEGSALQGMCMKCLLELGLEEGSHVVITGAAEPPAPPPTPEELQPLFPQYEILELLGQGGMGVVYRALHKGLEREVALKVLPAKAGRDPAFAERFAREAKALATLSHANITSVYDFGKAGEHFFLAMEFVDGLNLRQLLRAGRVSPKQALQIIEQICDALQYAHDAGVVHRDIKPENILLDRKGRLKITDFGLAKLLGRSEGGTGLTLSHQVMGTPHYMAPEQIEHPTAVDHRADIFSLGVVFYELLTGELPLGRFAPPSGKVRVDVQLDEVVLRALEKEPELRYQSAGAVRTDVRAIGEPGSGERAEGAGARPAAPAAAHRRVLPRPWHGPLGCLVAAILLAALGIGFVLLLPLAGRSKLAGNQQASMELLLAKGTSACIEERAEGRVGFSLPFRSLFGIDGEVDAAAAEELTDAKNLYDAAKAAHTRREIVAPAAARIVTEAFPDEAQQIREDLQARLLALLSGEAYVYLSNRSVLETELLPKADGRVVQEIRRTPEGYTWQTNDAEQQAGSKLPEDLRHHWKALYRPLGASAVGLLPLFLEEVRSFDEGRGQVSIQSIRIRPAPGLDHNLALQAQMIFQAESGDSALRLQEALRARLDALPGLSVPPARTLTLANSTEATLEVRASAPDPDLPLVPEALAAARAEQAGYDALLLGPQGIRFELIDPVGTSQNPGAIDRTIQLVQQPATAVPLEGQLAWLQSLEGLGPYSTVEQLDLERRKDDLWTIKLRFVLRQPAP
jgi:tRNA A-37 threonylcarbamoyl transferase component Bud32